MTSIGTLYTSSSQLKGKLIQAVAAWGGLSVEVPSDYKHMEDNKKPEYLSKFPFGKVPALETKDGFTLFEGDAIARYVAGLAPETGLRGSNAKEAALIDQWSHLAESEVDANLTFYFMLVKALIGPHNKPTQQFIVDRIERALKVLEDHLQTRTFFVGERITLADFVVASIIFRGTDIYIDKAVRDAHPNLIRHMETIINQPKVAGIFGKPAMIETAIQYVPPPKEKKEPKPQAAPKEKKPKKEEADDDDDEPSVPPEPKVKNPLDDLPKSQFNLEDWKRAYSNKDTRGPDGSLEWFYQNYDPQGYSIWSVKFKYNEELTLTFMSSNQIGGFFNRLEASRKYLFGSMGVLGTNNNSIIAGAFVTRGQEIEATIQVAPDWESYEYKWLDLGNADDKAFFEAALAWDLEIDGKKWADGKNFK
jgi:elongation factor 1-gamma